MELKEFMLHDKKENVYAFYERLNSNPVPYEEITRNDIYHNIISLYKDDPERILKLCSMEEIHILKSLIEENSKKQENGYIDYLLFQNLLHNYLILDSSTEYYIPEDIYNYVKMAINLFDEKTYSLLDVIDSTILGMSRVYNTLELELFLDVLKSYYIDYEMKDLKKYIEGNAKLNHLVGIVRFQKKDYVVSKEYFHYKDVLSLRKKFKIATYSLEEMISIGKYKLNLFQEKVFHFLNFLEIHLDGKSIDLFVKDFLFYCGFDINKDGILLGICDQIEELYREVVSVVPYFPIWIYGGNSLHTLKENVILPEKNEPCLCGSGKKFKDCCFKLFK